MVCNITPGKPIDYLENYLLYQIADSIVNEWERLGRHSSKQREIPKNISAAIFKVAYYESSS